MLAVLFFISVFSSLTWVAYMLLYLTSKLAGNDMSSLAVSDVALYVGLIIVPVWAIWQIFGLISQYKNIAGIEKKLLQLFNQMKKNQDYTDLIVRVMLDAEHEIKDGFVVNKFDVFIADMNEILADIVQRCNAASSLQMEQLWAKVKNGERWSIAKRLVETSKSHNDFTIYLAEKSKKDEVFRGTVLEFCYRYQNLSALLEKHDRDRLFITILETGVMGKVYSILAPVVDAIDYSYEKEVEVEEKEKSVDVSPRILDMKEPERFESTVSVWKKLNPFKKSKKEKTENVVQNDDDDFFAALEKSMNSPEQTHMSYKNNTDEDVSVDELPRFNMPKKTYEEPDLSPRFDMSVTEEKSEPFIELNLGDDDTVDEFVEEDVKAEETTEQQEENNFAYPFGGWVNEDNYKK